MYAGWLVVREKYYVSGCATSSVVRKKEKGLRSTPSILVLEDVFDCDTVFKT
jgi:hypothetical protein